MIKRNRNEYDISAHTSPDGKWYDSFRRMKQRPFHLVVVPKSVSKVWVDHVERSNEGGIELYAHQKNAVAKLLNRLFFLFAHGMGSGKTFTALGAIGVLNEECRVLDLVGMSKSKKIYQLDMATAIVKPLIVVVNYEAAWRKDVAERLERIKWSSIVFDECHKLKSPSGKASRWFARLVEKNPDALRLGLSGTPLSNSPLDAFGIFRSLASGVFGKSWVKFRARYAMMNPQIHGHIIRLINQDELAMKIDEHSDKVRTEDVTDLPAVRHQTIPVTLSSAERKAYNQLESDMVLSLPDDETLIPDNALVQLLKLAQLTGGFVKADVPGELLRIGTGIPDKLNALIDFSESLDENEPLVVICRFRSDLDSVQQLTGRKVFELSGRKNELQEWQDDTSGSVLAVQIAAGSMGIDLTRSAHCVFYSLGYSLGEYEQTLARCHRPGQTRPVLYTHLVVENSVDEKIYRALSSKKKIIDAVIGDYRKETEGATT